MISGGGKGAAYIPAKATDIRGLDPLAMADRFKKNGDDALKRQDKAEAKKAKEDKDFSDSLELGDKDFVANISTIDNFDDVYRHTANIYRDKYLGIANLAKEAKKSGDTSLANKYTNQLAKLKGNWKNANTLPESLLAKVENFKDLDAKGALSPADSNYAAHMTNLGKFNFEVGIDGNLSHQISLLNEDGKTKTDMKFSDFITGYKPVEVYDVDNFIKNSKALETSVTSNPEGSYIVTEEGISQQAKEAIEQDIAAATGGDAYMTDLLYKASGGSKNKRTGFTDEDRKQVSDFMRDKAYGLFKDEKKKKESKFALENQKERNRKKAEKEKEPKYSFEVVEDIKGDIEGETTASASDIKTQKYTVTEKTTGRGLVGIATGNPKTELINFKSVESNRTGDISIEGSFRTPENTTDENTGEKNSGYKTEQKTLNNEEITRFMDILRSRDDEESKSLLNELGKAVGRSKSRKGKTESTLKPVTGGNVR